MKSFTQIPMYRSVRFRVLETAISRPKRPEMHTVSIIPAHGQPLVDPTVKYVHQFDKSEFIIHFDQAIV